MTYPISNRATFSQNSTATRINVAVQTRPILDVQVGGALWRDRRVPVATKAFALFVGVVAMFALIALDRLAMGWIFGAQAVEQLSVSSLLVSGGSMLFSTIALLRLAPASVVNLARLQTAGAIPLRTRKR